MTNSSLVNPIQKTKDAISAVLADMVGLEVEDLHEHVIWLAFCDPKDIPDELEDIYDYQAVGRMIAQELYLRAYNEGTQEDFDLFWMTLSRPADVTVFALRNRIDLVRLCNDKLSRRTRPVRTANEALHIVHAVGPGAPKYFDALKYIVGGHDDVTAAMLENTLDMIDQVCQDLGIELATEDGKAIYDIDALIDKVTELANQ